MPRRLKAKHVCTDAIKPGDQVTITRMDMGFNIYEGRRLRVTSVDGDRLGMHCERALQSVMYDLRSGAARGYQVAVESDA